MAGLLVIAGIGLLMVKPLERVACFGYIVRTPLASPGGLIYTVVGVNPALRRIYGGGAMSITHTAGVKPAPSSIELGRGADGICVEVLDHPELVLKDMNHPFKLGRNRIVLELRVLLAVLKATQGLSATCVFNNGTDEQERSWLVRERVFDVEPRGSQADRTALVELILGIHPSADVSLFMLPDPTFDNVRWGYTEANPEPRWILIDP